MPGFIALAAVLTLSSLGVLVERSELVAAADLQLRALPLPQGGSTKDAKTREDIAKLVAELQLPGPEARQQRENAVAALLGMAIPEAHHALQDVLTASSDPEGMIGAVLTQLVPRLYNPRDPVLGDRADDRVKLIRASYVRPLAWLVGAPHAWGETVIEGARSGLLALESWERLPVFSALLAESDRPVQLAAARAAGRCQDLGLARLLAEQLVEAEGELLAEVKESLWRLTFHRAGFADVTEFDAWLKGRNDKFVDLAERAALRGAEELVAERAHGDEDLRLLTLELIRSYFDRPQIRWQQIQERLLAARPPGVTERGLKLLRELLAATEQLTGTAADRLALFEELRVRLDRARASGDHANHALLLEVCAYLVAPPEEQRGPMVTRLLEGLQSAQAEVRAAALLGLRRYPSDSNRQRVVEVVGMALEAGDVELLRVALPTLRARDWAAPVPDATSRQLWLRTVIATIQRKDLPIEVRRDALRVLDLRDERKTRVAEASNILLAVVGDAEEDVGFREYALLQLGGYVVDKEIGQRYVDLLAQCLGDPARQIRSRAAERIHLLPEVAASAEQVADWTRQLLEVARGRLLQETDQAIHQAIAENMRRTADGRIPAEEVIAIFCTAAEQLAGAPAERREPFRRRNLAEALSILARHQNCPGALWVRAGESLLPLEERDAVRAILERQQQNGSLAQPGVDPDVVRRARLLTVRAALLKPPGKSWKHESLAAEAAAVLDAVAELVAADALPASPDIALLRMDLHGDLEQHQAVVDLAEALQTSGPNALDNGRRQHAALRAARALLSLGRPDQARDWLIGLAANGVVADEVLQLLEDVGQEFLGQREFAEAERVGALLVERTPETSPRCPARLLLHARALYQVDPEGNARAVRDLLEEKQAIFTRADTPDQVRQQFDALLKVVRTS